VIDEISFAVIIPTVNAMQHWQQFESALVAAVDPQAVTILDSSSTDDTADKARAAGFRVHTIPRVEFNHGGTRQLAAEMLPSVNVLVYMTQDAVIADPFAIHRLVEAFTDPDIGLAFGRQLPRRGALPIEAHARIFNYPAQSSVRTFSDRNHLGFRSIFVSNSFAAYRREALMEVGGFPRDVIFGEDTVTAAKLLKVGKKIAYVAEARVYHSHSYRWSQEFSRYFDIGVLHSREAWLLDEFGSTGNEGSRFVRSELRYLWSTNKLYIPSALIRTALKFIGYKIGRNEHRLPPTLKRKFSMHKGYWK
jgi:rhamnosyltransferase